MIRLVSATAAVLGLGALFASAGPASADDALAPLRAVAVQDGGRVKPLDVYARESVRIVAGRAVLKREEGLPGEEPLETLLRWLAHPGETADAPLIRIRHQELREALGLGAVREDAGPDGDAVSFNALGRIEAFWKIMQGAAEKQRADQKTTPLEKRAGEAHAALARLGDIVRGRGPRVVAIPRGKEGVWPTAAALSDPAALEGLPPPDPASTAPIRESYLALLAAVDAGDRAALGASAARLAEACGATYGSLLAAAEARDREAGASSEAAERPPDPAAVRLPTSVDLEREVWYFRRDPLGWAVWGYLLGVALLVATIPVKSGAVAWVSAAPLLAAFGLHLCGIVVRVLVSGRPPVTNMYESIIWVSLGAAFFGLLLTSIQRVRLYMIAGGAMAWLGLSFTKASPMVLDPAISALVPVLRNNFWLSVHVPTVTLSYAAFALAMGLGHVAMGLAVFAPRREEALRRLSLYVYRAMQVGVLLLAAGTILGGVWAYYSWGRFWGWDPKEVGALAALLGYLAALHGRFAGWWRDFGLAVSAVMGFQMILVAWYGVNVLGVGLHSYGFSEGGLLILAAIAAVEGGICGLAAVRRRRPRGPEGPVPQPEAAAVVEA